jgi:hypothetical protein
MFNPANMVKRSKKAGWPAWWAVSIENAISSTLNGQYKGIPTTASARWKPGDTTAPHLSHFAEVDIMEYMSSVAAPWYFATLHDWGGTWSSSAGWSWNVTQGASFSRVNPPQAFKYTDYHRYGVLWIPASETSKGFIQYYLDGLAVTKKFEYVAYNASSAVPPISSAKPWLFGVLDRHHLMLVLGTGVDVPMSIRDVGVWQVDDRQDVFGR